MTAAIRERGLGHAPVARGGRSRRRYACDVESQTSVPGSAARSPIGRFNILNLRAAWWAFRAARRVRTGLRSAGIESALVHRDPPALPPEARRGVEAALRRGGHTCLERSVVMQAWLAAHGEERDLVIGVKAPAGEFKAHAWLEGEAPHGEAPFDEILRRPAPVRNGP